MNPGESSLPTRLKAALPGLGAAAQADVERRATELARIDGRDKVTDADIARAANELSTAALPTSAPETGDPALEELTAWDDPVAQSGHRVPGVPLEDEAPVGEQLIQDGVAEAEHHTRVAAGDEK
jgi:hypothetical protein